MQLRMNGLLCLAMIAGIARADESLIRPEHPRLLLTRQDVAAIRVRCGVRGYENDPIAQARGIRFGAQRDTHDRLIWSATQIMQAWPGPDDLYAPAMAHLIDGQLGRPDPYTRYVTDSLLAPDVDVLTIDALFALDGCWDAITPDKRLRIIDRLASGLIPLEPGDDPLVHRDFYRKVCSLAAAGVLRDRQLTTRRPQIARTLDRIVDQARAYMAGPFVTFCKQRGAMPTMAGLGMAEAADLALAVEIWRRVSGRSLWPELADSLGRALEPYFYADTRFAGIGHGFIHDDGVADLNAPVKQSEGFKPAVAWAIARQTRDPVATWYANRSPLLARSDRIVKLDRYQWVPLIYGPLPQSEAVHQNYPLGRNFGGGWVVMRSGWDSGDTVLLFDAGQPRWRSRQHFDAGQFQILRKGRLAIDSGDSVTFQAVPSKNGTTTIAGQPGDWDHYFQATIAHNGVTVFDSSHVMERYGRPWPAIGNQRLVDDDYDPTTRPIDSPERRTGDLKAFATNAFFTHASADLTPAYPPEVVTSIDRSILFLNAGAILVLDRIEAVGARTIKTWHLQLPDRPRPFRQGQIQPLDPAQQLHGVDGRAGVWPLDAQEEWLTVAHMKGRLFVRTLLPTNAKRRVMGGPMTLRTVPDGPSKGTAYYGGDVLGYEHRLWPATFLRSPNAAYRLGTPTALSPHFGVGATWGRLDVSPREDRTDVVFLHLLVPTDAEVTTPPIVQFEREAKSARLDIELASQHAHVEVDLTKVSFSRVHLRDRRSGETLLDQTLADAITSRSSP